MIKDQQVRELIKLMAKGYTISLAAGKSGMDRKTAGKYLREGKLPSECRAEHTWKTREDPFFAVWDEITGFLNEHHGLQAKTLFEYLQDKYPNTFTNGQLRTLQRKIKTWRALSGPPKEVYFPQIHYPGDLSESDFCDMSNLKITIDRIPFPHMLFHFVLTYSNWEAGSICYSESFESLSTGIQDALWQLGGVPLRHKTDSLSAAVKKIGDKKGFTDRYNALLNNYGVKGEHINTGRANENGDIEQRHSRTRTSIDQSLMLRGSRDFSSIEEYDNFLQKTFSRINSGRDQRFKEECVKLNPLPASRVEVCKKFILKVGPSSTIRIMHNTYSVNSRLIGERVNIRLFSDRIELWYAQKLADTMPRIRGQYRARINYRHIIDWLERKPGAFQNYRYMNSLFPTTRFRMAYDRLREIQPACAVKEYLKILKLAAYESEERVDSAINFLISENKAPSFTLVNELIVAEHRLPSPTIVFVEQVDLGKYDNLLMEAINQ